MVIKFVKTFPKMVLLAGALGALSIFSACEKQPESKLEAMTAHHHHEEKEEERAYDDPKAEKDALGERSHPVPAPTTPPPTPSETEE